MPTALQRKRRVSISQRFYPHPCSRRIPKPLRVTSKCGTDENRTHTGRITVTFSKRVQQSQYLPLFRYAIEDRCMLWSSDHDPKSPANHRLTALTHTLSFYRKSRPLGSRQNFLFFRQACRLLHQSGNFYFKISSNFLFQASAVSSSCFSAFFNLSPPKASAITSLE